MGEFIKFLNTEIIIDSVQSSIGNINIEMQKNNQNNFILMIIYHWKDIFIFKIYYSPENKRMDNENLGTESENN